MILKQKKKNGHIGQNIFMLIILRIPFEQMTYKNPNWKLVRINKDDCRTFLDIDDRSILIEDDIKKVINEL